MFTGIVRAVGRLDDRDAHDGGARVVVDGGGLDLDSVSVGDSIAVNGVCLTVVAVSGRVFEADVSAATLAATTLGGLPAGAALNLEPALTLATPLGGHLVTGHVDGVGGVHAADRVGESCRLQVAVPDGLARFIAVKGSVCVDGVSLTVNSVDDTGFEVNLVPHTLAATNLGTLNAGDPVNIEVDPVARYIDRLLSLQGT